MDISVCSLDLKSKTLQFSSAVNPLYLIHKGQLIVVKGDRFSASPTSYQKKLFFANHEINLQKGDSFYIFSDGFADQFGGPKGKKFKYKQFKNLLLSMQNNSMQEQRMVLDKTFNFWKGNLEQVDDVCVIGVRI